MNKTSKKLLLWYTQQRTTYPWRKETDVYKIWISEIMLQQTQVKTAIPYYNNWMKKFKNISRVANAEIDEILKAWEGLGYYQRAHNIYDTAQTIINNYDGIFPNTYAELIKLKGIGDYTASAIMSIAYHQAYPAIDGNLKRVIARLAGTDNFKNIILESKSYVLQLMKNNNPGEINQSLMDIGREICKIKKPRCKLCPIKEACVARQKKLISYYTFEKTPVIKPNYNVIVGLIWRRKKILISKRKKDGLLGGLWELPGGKKKKSENNLECLEREIYEELNIKVKISNKIGTIKHNYSHFGINLTAYNCNYQSGQAKANTSEEIKWISPGQVQQIAFPKATLKLFSLSGLYNE